MSRILSREKERDETTSIISPSLYPTSSSSLYNITTKQELKNKNSSFNKIIDHNDSNTINELDIADGLKHILISHGFTVDALLSISPTNVATMLGIDQCVANIQRAAKYYITTK